MITILRIFPVFRFLLELRNGLSRLLLEKAYHMSRFQEMQTKSYSLYRKSRKQQIIFYFLQQPLFPQRAAEIPNSLTTALFSETRLTPIISA